jgi:hypothetical protein
LVHGFFPYLFLVMTKRSGAFFAMAKRRPAGSGLSEDEDQTICRAIASAREAIQLYALKAGFFRRYRPLQ